MTGRVTLAICTNRSHLVPKAVRLAQAALGPDDVLMVVLDTAAAMPELQPDVVVLHNHANRGLAYSRNRALAECRTRFLIFIDDDIRPTRQAIEAARTALGRGNAVVGARISADLEGRSMPWHMTIGQLHYVGAHAPGAPASIWGGFLGVDVPAVRATGMRFSERLGRTADTLLSGEDTTFVRGLTRCGLRQQMLAGVDVRQVVHADRLRLAYLLRRAYWQGRTESRRRDARRGIRKELSRNYRADCPLPRRVALTVLYGSSVATGVLVETVVSLASRARDAGDRCGSAGLSALCPSATEVMSE